MSLYAYINPIIAVTLGVLVLNEPFTRRMAIAAALVFAGVAIVRWTRGAPSQAPQADPGARDKAAAQGRRQVA